MAPVPAPRQAHTAPSQEVAALINRAAQGDVAAFEQLVAQHQAKVFSFALVFTSDRDEAADLAQDAIIKVYRSIASFRFQSSFTTWLYQIVKNTFLDFSKSRASRERSLSRPIDGLTEQLAEAAMAEELLLREEDRRALARAIECVPAAYRMVLVLFDVQGLAYDEIAQVLGIPIGTVKSRLKRGRDALRAQIFRDRAASEVTEALAMAPPSVGARKRT